MTSLAIATTRINLLPRAAQAKHRRSAQVASAIGRWWAKNPEKKKLYAARSNARYHAAKLADPVAHAARLKRMGEARYGNYERWAQTNRSNFASSLRKFGITVEEYARLFHSQSGRCATCDVAMNQREFKERGRAGKGKRQSFAHVDHHHGTGIVRGLLCGHCNWTIGNARDNPETLRRLAAYLEENRGIS